MFLPLQNSLMYLRKWFILVAYIFPRYILNHVSFTISYIFTIRHGMVDSPSEDFLYSFFISLLSCFFLSFYLCLVTIKRIVHFHLSIAVQEIEIGQIAICYCLQVFVIVWKLLRRQNFEFVYIYNFKTKGNMPFWVLPIRQ